MEKNVKEWTLTLPSEFPHWELDSRTFKGRSQESKLIELKRSLYHCKSLGRRCLKWACMTHLGSSNISYGQKKDWESNWQFDSQPLKVRNHPNFLVCRWRATYRWNFFDKGYNFNSNFISIEVLHTKFCASKVAGVLILGILGLPLGNLRTKWHLGVGPWLGTKKHYKGEGGGFPQVWVVPSLVSPWLHVVCLCTKSTPTTH
jgi:hypothetical protein